MLYGGITTLLDRYPFYFTRTLYSEESLSDLTLVYLYLYLYTPILIFDRLCLDKLSC